MKHENKKVISINLENIKVSTHHLTLLLAGIIGASVTLAAIIVHQILIG